MIIYSAENDKIRYWVSKIWGLENENLWLRLNASKKYISIVYISQIRIQWKNLYDFVLEAYLLSMINNVF